MKFLCGTLAYNPHVANLLQALEGVGWLAAFYTGSANMFATGLWKTARRGIAWLKPELGRRIERRSIAGIPPEKVQPHWGWSSLRLAASQLGVDERIQDWLWDRNELALDERCARALSDPSYEGFVGTEYGSLASVRAAKAMGKKSLVAFLSPHHSVLEKWVWPEYEKYPELLTAYQRRVRRLMKQRTARKDEEARLADCVHCNSEFTARSLELAGIPRWKMAVVPLACPDPCPEEELPPFQSGRVRFLYAGPVSVRKGAHCLVEAWRRLKVAAAGELHLCGKIMLPHCFLENLRSNVFLHGQVSQAALSRYYAEASVLVLPTLCDGFGMVVTEALSHGLPVITTYNAGAADLIQPGRNGFVVAPGNTEALAEVMEWCAMNPGELHSMRREAWLSAVRRPWSTFRLELIDRLTAVLSAGSAARTQEAVS